MKTLLPKKKGSPQSNPPPSKPNGIARSLKAPDLPEFKRVEGFATRNPTFSDGPVFAELAPINPIGEG